MASVPCSSKQLIAREDKAGKGLGSNRPALVVHDHGHPLL
jgi:hypothetical protein